jgi:hypothetical protein
MRLPVPLLFAAVLLLGAIGLLSGCSEATSRTPTPSNDSSANDQRTITQLQSWNQRLLIAGRQKDDRIRSVTRLVHKMIDDLSGVSNRQGLVRGVRVDQPVYLRAEFPQTERSIRAAEQQFVRYLSVIESNLQEGEQKMKRMRHGQAPSESVPEAGGVDAVAEQLRAAEQKQRELEARVDSLDRILDATRADKASLLDQNDILAQSNEQLRRAYVVTGTASLLEEEGIVEKRFFRDATMRPLDHEKFRVTSTNARSIPFDGNEATVISPHQHAPSLYTVEPGRLVIHDPAAFWAISRYLVVETNG